MVNFVDERKDGDTPFFTNAEELFRLRFDAFSNVNQHDGAVGCHERAVRIFTEVLMARRIEDIDMMTFIIELQNRAGNGNTTLFFDFHPV